LLSFYEQLLRLYYFAKKLQSQTVSREKLHEQNSLEQKICTYNVDEIDPGLEVRACSRSVRMSGRRKGSLMRKCWPTNLRSK